MNFKSKVLGLLLVFASTWPLPSVAQMDTNAFAGERLAKLSHEERQQMRQQMREHWQQMPPEQQRDYRQERRERWQQLPPEERERRREDKRRRNEERNRGWP